MRLRLRQIVSADAGRLALLTAAAFGLGVLHDRLRPNHLGLTYRPPAARARALPEQSWPAGVKTAPGAIDLQELRPLVTAHRGLVVDARSPGFYAQGHIPGAINLPREPFAAEFLRQQSALDARRNDDVVVYCTEPDCPDADLVAQSLLQRGFAHVRVYREGWEEWMRAGLPQEASPR